MNILLFTLLSLWPQPRPAAAAAALNCETFYAEVNRASPLFSWTKEEKTRALEVMMNGSEKVSRTVVQGRRWIAPESVTDEEISKIAEANFQQATRYMVDHLEDLPPTKKTAIFLNRMLTKGLVPEQDRGNYLFYPNNEYAHVTDSFVGGQIENFYTWLESPAAELLRNSDPVSFAEKLHYNLAALDSFPDGNGRLSRLFADLALMRSGYAPAFYSGMKDYFAYGSPRARVNRAAKLEYFRWIEERGRAAMRNEVLPSPPSRLSHFAERIRGFLFDRHQTKNERD